MSPAGCIRCCSCNLGSISDWRTDDIASAALWSALEGSCCFVCSLAMWDSPLESHLLCATRTNASPSPTPRGISLDRAEARPCRLCLCKLHLTYPRTLPNPGPDRQQPVATRSDAEGRQSQVRRSVCLGLCHDVSGDQGDHDRELIAAPEMPFASGIGSVTLCNSGLCNLLLYLLHQYTCYCRVA